MDIHNIAIIAHVDHGKTTLVDQVLRYCEGIESKEDRDRILDSNDLERERGITIWSKNTAVLYKNTKINIVDTPGHSDFGGEVERVMKMVDACLLLVDAFEGPMPQTRFVLQKALALGHKIILVVNKMDRPGADPDRVVNDTMELFMELGADDKQIDFPVVYASAKQGTASMNPEAQEKDLQPLMDLILEETPVAGGSDDNPFVFQVTTLDYNEYLGRICIGRILDGSVKIGDTVILKGETETTKHRVTKLFTFLGLKRIETDEAHAGDITAIAGIPEMTIGDTLSDPEHDVTLPRIEIEPPTVSAQFFVNDSPFAGREGDKVTSRNIRERLEKELMTNLSLRVEDQGDSFKVSARGELQIAILIENMRREGFELAAGRPQVIFQEEGGSKTEPYEEVTMDLPEARSGSIIQELNRRKGQMLEMVPLSETMVRVKYEIPTRGLIGLQSFFMTETRGEGSLSSRFLEYRPYAGEIPGRARGAIISMEDGVAVGFALFNLQDRGDLFITPQTKVYRGMIIGLHAKETDLDVNPIKTKKLTNMRSSGADDALKLVPPKQLTLEQALDFLDDDELLEVTPSSLRLRKKILDPSMRKRGQRKAG